jgi:endonuclease/exonuclease/phosphatase family metal-dependent hydrolase
MVDPGLAADRSPSGSSLRVATLNLQGREGAWPERRLVLLDGFRKLRPDVVAFQEAIKNHDYDQVADLLGPTFHVAHQAGREVGGSGCSIASRWPIADVAEVELHATPRVDPAELTGSVAVAEIVAPDPIGPLLFANYPSSWRLGFEHERELEAVSAARFIEERIGQRRLHVVVAGDLNAAPDAASMRFWRGLQSLDGMSVCYRDAWEHSDAGHPGHTFSPRNPLVTNGNWALELGRRIDYILVRCCHHGPTLDIAACSQIFDHAVDGVWGSDHFGVVADLVVPTAEDPCWA